MADESKLDDPTTKQKAAEEAIEEAKTTSAPSAHAESENEDEPEEDARAAGPSGTSAVAKKKKSKRKRVKAALGMGSSESGGSSQQDEISRAVSGLSKEQISELLKMNPALAQTLDVGDGKNLTNAQAAEALSLSNLKLEDIMTGLASSGKNVKDMASYKFWQTQPVMKFGENKGIEEGPFKIIDPEQVPKEPGPLIEGFEWVTMDMTSDEEMEEVYQLLYGHYVEDDEAMFRFNYSKSFLKW